MPFDADEPPGDWVVEDIAFDEQAFGSAYTAPLYPPEGGDRQVDSFEADDREIDGTAVEMKDGFLAYAEDLEGESGDLGEFGGFGDLTVRTTD